MNEISSMVELPQKERSNVSQGTLGLAARRKNVSMIAIIKENAIKESATVIKGMGATPVKGRHVWTTVKEEEYAEKDNASV